MNILDHKLKITPLNIFIDPMVPVDKAIITHAHTGHARPGNKNILATKETIELMMLRFGEYCAQNFDQFNFQKGRCMHF